MTKFKDIIDSLVNHLNEINYTDGDLSDIGNEIGIAIGKHIPFGDDKEDFINGIKHGISLIDGTH